MTEHRCDAAWESGEPGAALLTASRALRLILACLDVDNDGQPSNILPVMDELGRCVSCLRGVLAVTVGMVAHLPEEPREHAIAQFDTALAGVLDQLNSSPLS